MKAEIPDLKLYVLPVVGRSSTIYFGWRPVQQNIFRDVRVRQALSKSWDRETWIDVFRNVSAFEAAGIPMETRWNTGLDAKFTGWWLDPNSKDFGPNAVNYKHDIAEAKKLLSAAGYANGTPEIDSVWPPTGQGLDFGKWVASLEGMAQESGFRFKTVNADLNTEWIQKYRDSIGDFEGIVWRNQGLVGGDPVNQLASEYMSTKGNIRFSGYDANGKGDYSGDPALEAMINNAKREFDVTKQKAIVADIQRHLAKTLYDLWFPGGATGLSLVWPVIANHRVYDDLRKSYYQWIDPTQAPLKKA
jgi:ABC-type transport system substrate-binding protein